MKPAKSKTKPSIPPRPKMDTHHVVEHLLGHIQDHFYTQLPKNRFYQERRHLINAITWPAHWLQERGLATTSARYQKLLLDRFIDIQKHGDPHRYTHYFPTYLLKCLQDYFHYHGENLYDQLKHVRNYVEAILPLLTDRSQHIHRQYRLIETLHQLHHITHPKSKPKNDPRQLRLF